MAIVDIWSIINPIKNELQQKAWQIVNDVTSRLNKIISGVIESAKFYITYIVNGVKNSLEWAIKNVEYAVNNAKYAIENKISEVKYKIEGVVSQISYKVSEIKDSFNTLLYSTKHSIENKITEVKWQIENKVSQLINNAERLIHSAIGIVETKINLLITTVSNISSSIINTIGSKLSSIKSDIENKISSTYEGIKSAVSGFVSGAKLAIENKIEDIKSRLSAIWDNIKLTVNDVKNVLIDTFNKIKDGLSARINQVYNDIKSTIENYMERIKSKYTEIKEDITSFINRQIQAVKDRLDKMVDDIKKGFQDLLDGLGGEIENWREIVSQELQARFEDFSAITHKLTTNEYRSYDEFLADFNKFGGEGGILSFLVGMVVTGSLYLNSVVAVGQPFARNISNLAMAEATPNLLSPSVVARAFTRGWISDEYANQEMRLNGINDERLQVLYDIEKEPTSPGEAQIAFLRGLINETTHDRILTSWGFTENKIALMKQLYFILPPIQDIITMAVREVFSTETAERFGQFEDFPVEFGEFARQQGLSDEWSKRYWAAHWSLPSPMQGFEMLHRRVIERDDLVMLLKALDIMPFWREKLIQISYNPLTRVDVRRMHKEGVLNETQVYESYLDIGYTETNARRLTEFTVKLNSKPADSSAMEIRQLTRNIIEQAYRQGIITRDNATERLIKIGYDRTDAEFLLQIQDSLKQIESSPDVRSNVVEKTVKMVLAAYSTRTFGQSEALEQLLQLGLTQLEASTELGLIDYEVNTRLKQRYVDSIQDLYTNWVIDESQVFIYLNDLGFSQGEISLLLTELDIVRNTRTKLPTKEDLKRWVKTGITTLDEYINDMKGQGFPDIYIQRYVAELGDIG